jgi:hypothetical protein
VLAKELNTAFAKPGVTAVGVIPSDSKNVIVVTAPPQQPIADAPKRTSFICKSCNASYDHFPATGVCAQCGKGAFKTVDVLASSAEHTALCNELAQGIAAKPIIPIAPAPATGLKAVAQDTAPSTPAQDAGVICVFNKDFWACDNPACGSDDLLHEVPVPPPDKKQLTSRYQCLSCGAVGKIMLQWEELVSLRGSSAPVAFKLGKDDWKLLKKWRDSPVPSETAVKAAPAQQAKAPELMPSTPASKAATVAAVARVAADGIDAPGVADAAPVKRQRGRPKKSEAPAQPPESFPGVQGKTAVDDTARSQATEQVRQVSQVGQVQSQAPTPDNVALVAKIAGYEETSQVDPAALAQEMKTQIQDWTMEKVLKEAEALTGQTIDLAKMSVPTDKNIRQVLEELVIVELIGKTLGGVD